jgi:hypothetical protein
VHDVGDLVAGRPGDLHLVYAQQRCTRCRKHCNADRSDYAAPKAHYTHRVVALAVRLVVEDGLPSQAARWHRWRDHRVLSPRPPSQTGWRRGGKKAAGQMGAAYLDGALADCPGYLAADEWYDGPLCVLSIVANRTGKRRRYQAVDHDPDPPDLAAFRRRFQEALAQRGLTLKGVTTDASPLYPKPLRAVFGAVPHPLGAFHILKELTTAVLRAVAKVRKQLAAPKPPLQRGRPSTPAAKRAARPRQRRQRQSADLFAQRHLFVQHDWTRAQRRTLRTSTRGSPPLRTLRDIREDVYRWFDRRCRTDTALAKLARLRQRVRRFQAVGKVLGKLPPSNLEKALTFLDDKLLPSTANAVERGNRRHRTVQKTV